MKILCFGDSNTYGFDPRSYIGERYQAEFRWVDIVSMLSGRETINAGENGREIPHRHEEFSLYNRIYFSKNYDLNIIMLGGNDLMQGLSAIQVADRMEFFLSHLSVPAEKLLLIAPPEKKHGTWVTPQVIEQSSLLPALYKKLAMRLGIHFADASEWDVELAFDGVHFTEKGNICFAHKLNGLLNKIL